MSEIKSETIYFDNAATTKPLPKVIEEVTKSYTESYGNPSSTHRIGQKVKGILEKTRGIVARHFGVENSEIIFTSGGAEGNNLILKGASNFYREKGNHIITSKIEHPTVLDTCRQLEKDGFRVTYLDVTEDGVIDLEQLKKEITAETIIVSIMYANNETGVVQPIKEIGEILKDKNILFHTDAVQAVGKQEINIKELNIGALTATAHKFYGLKGAGFIFLDKRFFVKKEIFRGSQERNSRAGTENVNGILALGVALEEISKNMEETMKSEKELLSYLEKRVKTEIEDVKVNGELVQRIGNVASITLKRCDIQTMLIGLDMRNICVSGGSACMSGAQEDSHVLKAMGLDENDLKSTLRVSLGRYNTVEEVDYFVEKLKEVVEIERKN